MSRIALVLASLVGCQDKFYVTGTDTPAPPTDAPETDDVPTDAPPETDTETDGEPAHTGLVAHTGHTGLAGGHSAAPAHSAAPGLPDPRTAMVPDACASQPFYNPNAPTATRYYAGDFTVGAGDRVTGEESMHLFFNATATQVLGGLTECVVVWTTTGSAQQPGVCRSCTTGLGLRMAVDPALTDCPAGFWAGSGNFSVDYDVDADPSGESTFTFANTGTYLGQWYWEYTRYTYLSDFGCQVF